jgi:Cytochrome c554 and c-prime
VKTNKKTALFLLTIAFILILVPGFIQNDQAYSVFDKSDFLLNEGNSRSLQEKSKYLYVGAEKCASACHNNGKMGFQYNIMKSGTHSKAFEILTSKKAMHYAKNACVKENPQESSVCIKCHVTGGSLDSSFFAATYKKDDGVNCEACHKREYVTKAFLPKESDCLTCHNNSIHRIPKFDFKENCAKIAHPRPKPV